MIDFIKKLKNQLKEKKLSISVRHKISEINEAEININSKNKEPISLDTTLVKEIKIRFQILTINNDSLYQSYRLDNCHGEVLHQHSIGSIRLLPHITGLSTALLHVLGSDYNILQNTCPNSP